MASVTEAFFNALLREHVTGCPVDALPESLTALDETLFFQLAEEHRLLLIFSAVLKKYTFYSETLKQRFQTACAQKIHRHLLMHRCLRELTSFFTAENIRFIVLKGLPLNQQLYGEAILRTSQDIDLLIHVNDLVKVHRYLLEVGYALTLGLPPDQLMGHPHLLKHIKDIVYQHQKYAVRIELHWNVTPVPKMNFANVDAQPFPLKNNTLPPEDNFLYLCLHAAHHHWERLHWLTDVALFYQKFQLHWARIVFLAQQHDSIRPLLEAKILLEEKFALRLPYFPCTWMDRLSVKLRLRYTHRLWKAKMQVGSVQENVWESYYYLFFYSLLLPTWKQKWRYFIELLWWSNDGLAQLKATPHRSKSHMLWASIGQKLGRFLCRCCHQLHARLR